MAVCTKRGAVDGCSFGSACAPNFSHLPPQSTPFLSNWPVRVVCLRLCGSGLIVAKALRTIDRSQDLGLKMLKQPTHKQMDYYYSKLLGEDWQKQLEQDFIDAVAEVDGGYITDDMVRGSSRNKQRCQA